MCLSLMRPESLIHGICSENISYLPLLRMAHSGLQSDASMCAFRKATLSKK